jgi:hypothetical protein
VTWIKTSFLTFPKKPKLSLVALPAMKSTSQEMLLTALGVFGSSQSVGLTKRHFIAGPLIALKMLDS